jgi:cytochrome-b5 reductase
MPSQDPEVDSLHLYKCFGFFVRRDNYSNPYFTMYTLEEVQKHNKPDDVWIILHNKVYDVTKYLEDHPGGSAILIEVAGTDATEAFEEIGHSDEARDELAQYHVGDLPDEVYTSNPISISRPFN